MINATQTTAVPMTQVYLVVVAEVQELLRPHSIMTKRIYHILYGGMGTKKCSYNLLQ